MKTVVAALLFIALAGCSPYKKGEIVRDRDNNFKGLVELLQEQEVQGVDVISIHGMCTHTEDWAKQSGERVSVTMEAGKPKPEDQKKVHEGEKGLVVWKTAIDARNVDVYAILWSPLTTEHKKSLCRDSGMNTRSCPNAGDRGQGSDDRDQARLNNKLKSKLMNDCLADAMLYVGDSRNDIQEEVQLALEKISESRQEKESENRAAVIIAESLGSSIIADLFTLHRGNAENMDVLRSAFRATRAIFLAANQIKMLHLAQKKGGKPTSQKDREENKDESLLGVMKEADESSDSAVEFVQIFPEDVDVRQVVFTDPNDVLGYETDHPDHINIRVSNAPTYFWLLENPYAAHTAYVDNPTVWKYIMCGDDKDCGE